jgi:hypothetical protein
MTSAAKLRVARYPSGALRFVVGRRRPRRARRGVGGRKRLTPRPHGVRRPGRRTPRADCREHRDAASDAPDESQAEIASLRARHGCLRRSAGIASMPVLISRAYEARESSRSRSPGATTASRSRFTRCACLRLPGLTGRARTRSSRWPLSPAWSGEGRRRVLGFRKDSQDLGPALVTPTWGEPKHRRWLGVAAARRATRLRSSPAMVSGTSPGQPIYRMRPGS